MLDLYSRFPVLRQSLYFNHAAIAPWPQVTADAVQRFAGENAQQGSLNFPHWLVVEEHLREQARQLLNAGSARDIALIKNTSEGLSFVAYGLHWQAGDNVVGIRQEFPSNRYVWQSLAGQGVEFRQLDLDVHAEAPEDALLALCDARTRLLSVSAVQFSTGLRLDLERIGAYCRAHGILFCVDAIQQLGAIPFDVERAQADFVVADGHKWMLGPEGLGLFYVRRSALEQLRLTQYGWHMVENLNDYNAPHCQPALDARRLECGSPNRLGIHALAASLDLLLETGMENVWQRLFQHTEHLLSGLAAIPGLEILSDPRVERRSGILTFRSRSRSNEELFGRLQEQGVFCALRGGGIRLSPHFYTPPEHLDRVLNSLE